MVRGRGGGGGGGGGGGAAGVEEGELVQGRKGRAGRGGYVVLHGSVRCAWWCWCGVGVVGWVGGLASVPTAFG